MKKVDWILSERRRIARYYDENINKIPALKPLIIPSHVESSYYKYIAFLKPGLDREAIKRKLKEKYEIVLPGEVYSDPCHSQPVFKKYPESIANAANDTFPNTDYVCKNQICFPLYPGLSDEELAYIMKALEDCVR
jgi:dTDP-4-amino-4,6-dideoxygalactose transaminase